MKRLVIALSMMMVLLTGPSALAYNPLNSACTAGVNQSSACDPSNADPLSGKNGILYKITLIVSIVAGIAAVILVIISALQFLTSGGDPQKATSARKTLLGAVVGIIIVAGAQAILAFVIGRI